MIQQCGFKLEKSIADQIFRVPQILEKTLEIVIHKADFNRTKRSCFNDMSKFDNP